MQPLTHCSQPAPACDDTLLSGRTEGVEPGDVRRPGLRGVDRERGATMVVFALVLTVLVPLVLFSVNFAQMISNRFVLEKAAESAARDVAIACFNSTCADADAGALNILKEYLPMTAKNWFTVAVKNENGGTPSASDEKPWARSAEVSVGDNDVQTLLPSLLGWNDTSALKTTAYAQYDPMMEGRVMPLMIPSHVVREWTDDPGVPQTFVKLGTTPPPTAP